MKNNDKESSPVLTTYQSIQEVSRYYSKTKCEVWRRERKQLATSKILRERGNAKRHSRPMGQIPSTGSDCGEEAEALSSNEEWGNSDRQECQTCEREKKKISTKGSHEEEHFGKKMRNPQKYLASVVKDNRQRSKLFTYSKSRKLK